MTETDTSRRDFLKKYIFPGSCLPGVAAMLEAVNQRTDLRTWHIEDIGPHYATTLLRQGASGYLNKECDPQEIAHAIRTVARGRRYITPAVAELLADGFAGGADRPPHEALSERELQVFLRLARGETVGHIAEQMCLSVKTVSTYRSRVMDKLKLHSNSDLTYYALKNGLIQ